MVLLDQLWDDIVAGPQPDRGLKHLKKVYTKPMNDDGKKIRHYQDMHDVITSFSI